MSDFLTMRCNAMLPFFGQAFLMPTPRPRGLRRTRPLGKTPTAPESGDPRHSVVTKPSRHGRVRGCCEARACTESAQAQAHNASDIDHLATQSWIPPTVPGIMKWQDLVRASFSYDMPNRLC